MATTSVKGYPTVFGDRRVGLCTHTGVNPYVAGGDTIYPSAFGMKYFDAVFAMGSDDTNYTAEVVNVTPSSAKVIWKVRTTGAECGGLDLHAVTVKLMAFGPK